MRIKNDFKGHSIEKLPKLYETNMPVFENCQILMPQILSVSQYSKTCLERPLKKKTKTYRLMQVKSIAECSKRAFCNSFDLH